MDGTVVRRIGFQKVCELQGAQVWEISMEQSKNGDDWSLELAGRQPGVFPRNYDMYYLIPDGVIAGLQREENLW